MKIKNLQAKKIYWMLFKVYKTVDCGVVCPIKSAIRAMGKANYLLNNWILTSLAEPLKVSRTFIGLW